jgi:hypothetical protein
MNRADRRAFFASAETMAKKVAAEADWPARWDAYCGCMQGSVDFAAGADFAPQDVMKLFGGDLARRVIEKCGAPAIEGVEQMLLYFASAREAHRAASVAWQIAHPAELLALQKENPDIDLLERLGRA